ncbi:hypothetical protein CRUP_010389 [Coryphaenoides rupestris]|nr:hypothetical protein CRUP_010389 [Coryphaenoides rupestris]
MDYDYMEAATPNSTVRSERSLGLLTIKFVTLLQKAEDGVVNLKEVEDSEEQYQIHLKSVNGPIDVLLINKDPAASTPVSLPVPPPRDLFSRSPLFAPLLKLSPPPSERDYTYNLDESEGISDLFDVCVLKT